MSTTPNEPGDSITADSSNYRSAALKVGNMSQIVTFGFYCGVAGLSTIASLACLANPVTGIIGVTMLVGGFASATKRRT